MENDSKIMTLAEVAEYLKLTQKTVLKMVHNGSLPCARVGSQWRFVKSVVDEWLIAKMNTNSTELNQHEATVSGYLDENFIVPELQPGTKKEVLMQLIKPLTIAKAVSSEKRYLKKLMDRETMASTAIGHGVAVPHIRRPQENFPGKPDIILGLCRPGTDFASPDGEKTFLFFLLCTENETLHLRLFQRIAFVARSENLLPKLRKSISRNEIYHEWLRREAQLRSDDIIETSK